LQALASLFPAETTIMIPLLLAFLVAASQFVFTPPPRDWFAIHFPPRCSF
jgi:hypothetical protein